MSCRCVQEQWQRDRERQRALAKKAAILTGETQVLFRLADGRFSFVAEGTAFTGQQDEIITPY